MMTNTTRVFGARKSMLAGAFRCLAAVGLPLVASACSTPERLEAVPFAKLAEARPAVDNVRFVVGDDPRAFMQEGLDSARREREFLARSGHTGPLPPAAFLAISGGGGDGAYGAGLITGWPAADRPVFKLVTGISTGALTAPFAFLGPKYDGALREVYTTSTDDDIFKKRGIVKAIFGDAMADTTPLHALVARYITPEFLAEIAAEHEKGRLLLIGTTDLDARRGVIWNMTALAASKDPDAIDLFRKILVASAAIPGAFPPMMIDVTVDGARYQEMHVDGGASAQVFIYPPTIHLKELTASQGQDRTRTLYIIRNAKIRVEQGAPINRRTLNIAGTAISSLIQAQGNGDLVRIFLTSRRDGLDYNLAVIPPDFDVKSNSQFDPVYMSQLFARGQDMAAKGYPWHKYPPGFEPDEQIKAP